MFGLAVSVTPFSDAKSGDDAFSFSTHALSAGKSYAPSRFGTAMPAPVPVHPGETLPPRAFTLKPSCTTSTVNPRDVDVVVRGPGRTRSVSIVAVKVIATVAR